MEDILCKLIIRVEGYLRLLQFQIKCQVISLKEKNYQLVLILIYLQKNHYLFFFGKNKFKLKPISQNLIDVIWKRKIIKNNNKFYLLPNKAISENYRSKIVKITKYLKKKKSDFLFVTASENNAWLLNIRGRDTKYAPIPYSYILIDKDRNIKFFCDLKKVSSSLRKKF